MFLLDAYVPLTADGNIAIDGVLASCYASFNHDLAHFIMSVIQWYPEMTAWIFGVNNGTPEYVNIAKNFGRLVLPNVLLFGKSGWCESSGVHHNQNNLNKVSHTQHLSKQKIKSK